MASLLQKFAAKTSASTTPVASTPAPAPAVVVSKPTPAPKAKPAPAPVKTVEAEVVEPTRALSTNVSASILALLSDEGAAMDGLNAIMERPEGGKTSFDGPFPLIKLQSGNGESGGKWAYGENVETAMRAFLPVAAQPTTGVFMANRLRGTAWPRAYDEAKAQGVVDKAIWDVTVSSIEGADITLAIDAAEAVQYTKKADRSKFDGLGHLSLGLEILMYREESFFVIRVPQMVSSTVRTLKSLTAVMQGIGGLRSTPVIVTPLTIEESGTTAFKSHSLAFSGAMTGEGAAVWKSYQALRPQLLQDEEFMALFNEWNMSDISGQARGAMTTLASMRTKR